MKELNNKVSIITGAASGIGKATAFLFAKEGAKVVISDINEEAGNDVVKEIISAGDEAIFIKADTSQPGDNEALVQQTIKHYGRLDIAINNAGIGGVLAPTAEYTIENWQKVIDINLSGIFYGMKYQIAAMLPNGGSIVNVSSILGQVATKYAPAYVAAKHGMVGLTKTAAIEYATQGIRVNVIGPGYIKTPLLNNMTDEQLRSAELLHPMNRLGEVGEIAELLLFLSSQRSSFITGAYYAADGGYLAW